MVGKSKAAIIPLSVFLAVIAPSFARAQSEQKDSLVRLMQATSLQLIDSSGVSYRKAIDATFLHNGTFLVCDTALWNVNAEYIDCNGNVQLIQDQTELTSDRLIYRIPDDLAEFRGTLVELRNSEDDILRTRHLDYNTRDSVALFSNGGSLRDKNGQIIESVNGSYESVGKRFTFEGNVDMYADSIFVKTEKLTYDSEPNIVNFLTDIDFWKDGNMLSGSRGWYRREDEVFFFDGHVHAMSEEQEAWSDSMYFYRIPNDLEMRSHAQIQDTTRNMFGLAEYVYYSDSLSRVTMRNEAAIAIRTEQKESVDTLYCGADEFIYHTKKKCDIPDDVIAAALTRLNEIMADPVNAYRTKAAEAAAKAAADEEAKRLEERGIKPKLKTEETDDEEESPGEEIPVPADSLSAPVDTVAAVPDTSKIGFLEGNGRVKMFRKDIQLRCDSLRYNDLDSIVRCYKDPIIWNEGNRQYSSDSLFILIRDGGADRASLMSNAFIVTKENDLYFDQIRGTDVMAYFDSTSALRRFDALGGANALFYLQENDEFATVNKVESKMLSATMKDGSLQRVYYYDNPKNNAYPIAQLPSVDSKLKGFFWNPEDRPEGREDITSLSIRPSERDSYESRPKTSFEYTDVFFPGYMEGVYKSIEEAKERARIARLTRDSLDRLAAMADTAAVAAVADSSAVQLDSLMTEVSDSTALENLRESSDSLAASAPAVLTERQLKEQERQRKREEAELARSLRIARRDAKWAEKDAADAAKAEKKEAKKLARKQAREEMLRKREEKQAIRDEEKLQKYIDRYEKQKKRNERKQQTHLEP